MKLDDLANTPIKTFAGFMEWWIGYVLVVLVVVHVCVILIHGSFSLYLHQGNQIKFI